MKNCFVEFTKYFAFYILLIVTIFLASGCEKKDELLVPIKPNLPKVDYAEKGTNVYESLINLLKELDNRRAVEESYNK